MKNNPITYLVRRAERQDSRAVWEIRNNPLNRKKFNNSEEIPFEQHDKWFEKKYFGGQGNKCFVLEINGGVIGYCRFDSDDSGYLTSIAIDPEYAGKGYGGILLGKALKELKTNEDVFAEVHSDNLPSLNIFKKNGFIVYKTEDHSQYLVLKK